MRVNFTPPLPFNKEHLLRHMPVGHLIKFVITYATPFWREDGLSGEVVSYDNFDVSNDGKPKLAINKNKGTSKARITLVRYIACYFFQTALLYSSFRLLYFSYPATSLSILILIYYLFIFFPLILPSCLS